MKNKPGLSFCILTICLNLFVSNAFAYNEFLHFIEKHTPHFSFGDNLESFAHPNGVSRRKPFGMMDTDSNADTSPQYPTAVNDTWKKLAVEETITFFELEKRPHMRVFLKSFKQPDPTYSYEIQLQMCIPGECVNIADPSESFSYQDEGKLIQAVPSYNVAKIASPVMFATRIKFKIILLNGHDEILSNNEVPLLDVVSRPTLVYLNQEKTRSLILEFH